jgi:hypothetical protein
MNYKIIDTQGGGLMQDDIFDSKNEVIDRLASFHSIDWSDERYNTIYEWLLTMKDEEDQLNALLEWGQWELEPIRKLTVKHL